MNIFILQQETSNEHLKEDTSMSCEGRISPSPSTESIPTNTSDASRAATEPILVRRHLTFYSKVPQEPQHVEEVGDAVTQATEEDRINLGFLHRMFKKCLPNNSAIFLFILVTFCLSASDAISDMALSYFLYSR